MLRPSLAAALAALILAGHPAQAHHPFAAEYDANAPVLLRGDILAVEWAEPHVRIFMQSAPVFTGRGSTIGTLEEPVPWVVEAASPERLVRSGLSPSQLEPGIEIFVRGYQTTDKRCPHSPVTGADTCKAHGRDLTFAATAQRVFIGTPGAGAPLDGADPR